MRRSYSTTSEWDLVCGDSWKRNLVQTAFFSGWLLGGAGFGLLADEYGARKRSSPIACLTCTDTVAECNMQCGLHVSDVGAATEGLSNATRLQGSLVS